ncbi:MAG: LPS export ABC transporter periplasmic protein LptC [Bacteroidota bacterium]
MGQSFGRFFISIACTLLVFASCDSNKDLLNTPAYDGPIRYIVNESTLMTDSGRALVKRESVKRLDFENGDQEWPEGFSLEIYNKDGSLESTFRADKATYDNREDLFCGTGNVIVKNFDTSDELNTEELFYDPGEGIFFTEKFVTITSDDELHTGEGLTADENFTTYTIHKPEGELSFEEEEF